MVIALYIHVYIIIFMYINTTNEALMCECDLINYHDNQSKSLTQADTMKPRFLQGAGRPRAMINPPSQPMTGGKYADNRGATSCDRQLSQEDNKKGGGD